MKFSYTRGLLLGISLSLGYFFSIVYGQFNEFFTDETLSALIETTTRGYTEADKDKVMFKGLSGSVMYLQLPVAKKDGKILTNYFITRGPISYEDLIANVAADNVDNLADDLSRIRASTDYTNDKAVFEVRGDQLYLYLSLDTINTDIYVTVSPEDEFGNLGNMIEDYKIHPSIQVPGHNINKILLKSNKSQCVFDDYNYALSFRDSKRNSYHTYIDQLREDCIATPLSGKNFSPNSLITEGEFIKWIVKKYAISLGQADILSTPVRGYTTYYTQAKERGILKSTYKSKPTKVVKGSFMSQVIENGGRNVTMSNVSYTRGEMAMIFSVME